MQCKASNKQDGEGSGLQTIHSLGFKMHAELRVSFKTWWSSEDTGRRLQCFFKLFASHINIQFRWAEGRCIRVSCFFLSSHSHKIVSLLEPVSYSADPVIAVPINSDPVSFCLSCQQKHCHHGLSRIVWQYYMHLLGCHAPGLLILGLLLWKSYF